MTGASSGLIIGGTATFTGGGGGATIPSTTNLIAGDGAGNGADSGIAPANVVTAAANITSTALVKGSGGAKGVATTDILVDASNNVSGMGTLASGAITVTSTSATAFSVGRQGATNPVLQIDASVASNVTGLLLSGKAAGGGFTMSLTSSGTNESATYTLAKGTGTATLTGAGPYIINGTNSVQLQSAGTTVGSFGSNQLSFTNATRTTNTGFLYTYNAASSLTASTVTIGVDFNLASIQSHSTGALASTTDFRIRTTTQAFTASSTLTNAYGLLIDGAPIAGTNATVTNSTALYIGANAVGAGTASSYGLQVNPQTGATTNWGLFAFGKTGFDSTITAGGNTGGQVINKPSGTVNFAAAASTLTVTNSLCTTSSIVFATVRTNDATSQILNVVPGAGSFVINLVAPATAETSVGFFIIN